MKIARKQIHVQQDCFEASEKEDGLEIRVRITRFRHTVIIDASDGIQRTCGEISLSQLACMLRDADLTPKP